MISFMISMVPPKIVLTSVLTRHIHPAINVIRSGELAGDLLSIVSSPLTGGYVESRPAVAGGTVYVGSLDGKVYALNAGT